MLKSVMVSILNCQLRNHEFKASPRQNYGSRFLSHLDYSEYTDRTLSAGR